MATRHHRNPSKPKLEVVPPSPLPVSRSDTHSNVVYNRILLSLPDDEYNSMLPHLEFVELRLHQSLYESPDGLEYGYFLNFGLASRVIQINDGRSVEVGIVGREGFVGTPLAAICLNWLRLIFAASTDANSVPAAVAAIFDICFAVSK